MIIQDNPGIKFREIMRITGMKNGVLGHHLNKIEEKGLIHVERKPRNTRFFPLRLKENSQIISSLRRPTSRGIILSILQEGNHGLEFSEIVHKINRSPSTISFYLSKLAQEKIIVTSVNNRKKLYKVKEKIQIDQLIEQYHPHLVEKASDSFTDIFNSL